MQLRLCNRSQYPTHVRLLSLDQFVVQENIKKFESTSETEQMMSSSLVGHDLSESPASLAVNLRSMVANGLKVRASFQLPAETNFLPARDDLAGYEFMAAPQYDPKY